MCVCSVESEGARDGQPLPNCNTQHHKYTGHNECMPTLNLVTLYATSTQDKQTHTQTVRKQSLGFLTTETDSLTNNLHLRSLTIPDGSLRYTTSQTYLASSTRVHKLRG